MGLELAGTRPFLSADSPGVMLILLDSTGRQNRSRVRFGRWRRTPDIIQTWKILVPSVIGSYKLKMIIERMQIPRE